MSATASSPLQPATAPIPMTAQEDEIRRVFALQESAALRLRTSTVEQRIARLKRLREVLLQHSDAVIEAGIRDFRRPAAEIEMTELLPVLLDISDTCRHLRKWLRRRRVRPTGLMLGTSAWVRYEPRGRCLIIAPWNYPVTLTLGPLVPAVACGNTVIIKTSEVAPHFSRVLVQIIRQAFSEDEVAVFEGDAAVATALLALPFDHCFFTGAPAIGKVVMQAAAKHLTSVTLELGGKSPTIIDRTADLKTAVQTIAWGKFINSGQTCIAPDHIYVHEEVKDEVCDLFRECLARWYGEGETAKEAELARVINERHTRRIAGLIEDAKNRGARLVFGGTVDVAAHFVSPTLLTDVPTDAAIMREEIFGPVLPIIPFRSVDEVVENINRSPKPLAMYIWTRDGAMAESIIERTSAGATCINNVGVHFLHHNLPFGGVNNSGIGSYHGEWGIRAFSHERAILKTRFLTVRMFFPPYGPRLRRIINFALRFL
ncbi:MAG: aldehyde dehydrogenase family protein [Sinobacteraceae bacterium]|nr:aldehyde dehydrogenase family protein [Nevskiaceae bacterium]